MTARHHWPRHALAVLACAPAVTILLLILRYGVDVPFYDQWVAEAPLFEKVWGHQFTIGDLWVQHNEHRMVFPKIVYLLLAWATHWNIRAELVTTWVFACAISLGIFCCQRGTVGVGTPLRMLQFVVANLLIFSPAPFEAWLWGISIVNIIPMACIVWSLAIASSHVRHDLKLISCAALATISTFSAVGGSLCWLLAGPVLFVHEDTRNGFARRHRIAIWVLGFVLTSIAYFHGYEKPPSHPSPMLALREPANAIEFLLIFFGNSLTPFTHFDYFVTAQLVGSVLLLSYVAACEYLMLRRRDGALIDRSTVWLMLGLYSVLNGLLITFSRLGFGPVAAMWPRYVSYSANLPLALLFLLPILLEDVCERVQSPAAKPVAFSVLSAMLGAALLLHSLKGLESTTFMRRTQAQRLQGKAALLFIDFFRDESIKTCVTRSDDDVRPLADVLNAFGFLHPPLLKSPRLQDIERPNAPREVTNGALERMETVENDDIVMSGWTFVPRTGTPADAVVLSYDASNGDSIAFAVADMDTERRAEPPESPMRRAGWQVAFPAGRLPAGTSKVCAWALDANRAEAIRLPGCREVMRG
jgi:hypothetical protein